MMRRNDHITTQYTSVFTYCLHSQCNFLLATFTLLTHYVSCNFVQLKAIDYASRCGVLVLDYKFAFLLVTIIALTVSLRRNKNHALHTLRSTAVNNKHSRLYTNVIKYLQSRIFIKFPYELL